MFFRRKKRETDMTDLPAFEEVEGFETFKNLLLGTEYESFVMHGTPRAALLKKVQVGDPVTLRWYKPKGWRATLLVCFHTETGIDLGSITKSTADRIRNKYPDGRFVGRVIEMPKLYNGTGCRIEYKVF